MRRGDLRIPSHIRRRIGVPPGLITVRFGLGPPPGEDYGVSEEDRAIIEKVLEDNQSSDTLRSKEARNWWSAQTFGGGFTLISGTLESTPSTRKKKITFIIQFFSSPSADSPSGYGEGKTFLGEIQVKTDRQGKVKSDTGTFGFAPFQTVPVGQFITATATNKKTGDTSEFSEAERVEPPEIGP
jgi:hypothetical protein